MEVNKSENSTNETKTMDIISDNVEVKKKSTISFIHVFESDKPLNPEFEIIKKKTHRKKKFRNRKAKPRLLANKDYSIGHNCVIIGSKIIYMALI